MDSKFSISLLLLSIITLFLLLPQLLFGQLTDLPFKSGEKLHYKVSYNWEFVWLDAGKVTFMAEQITGSGHERWHFKSHGRSLSAYDWIFKVRDKYESQADVQSFVPHWYLRNTLEGKFRTNNRLTFLPDQKIIVSETENSNKAHSVDTLLWDSQVFDLQTAVYYARSLDFTEMKPGQKIPLSVVIDGAIYDLSGVYQGIEVVENFEGTLYRCHRFGVMLVAGTIFREGEEATIWLSADKNKIPILVEAKILVGSVKAHFVKGEALKYPMDAILDD